MLQETQRLGFRRVVLVGHLGKLIKVAAGIFHTHSHIADGRMETLVTRLALMGAPRELLQAVFECSTTEAAMELIEQHGLQAVYNDIAQAICARINQMLRFAVQPLQCDAVLFSFDNIVLGSNRPVNDIVADLRTEISQEILCERSLHDSRCWHGAGASGLHHAAGKKINFTG